MTIASADALESRILETTSHLLVTGVRRGAAGWIVTCQDLDHGYQPVTFSSWTDYRAFVQRAATR